MRTTTLKRTKGIGGLMLCLLTAAFFLLMSGSSFAQTGGGAAINKTNLDADPSAILDVSSNTQGLLIPRMSMAERNAIVDPASSLIIYQTDNTPGYYYNSGTPGAPIWTMLGGGGGGGGGASVTCTAPDNTNYTIRGTGSNAWECSDVLKIFPGSDMAVSINAGNPSPYYQLWVNSRLAVGSSPPVSTYYELAVDGDTYLDGYVGIGVAPNSSYRLNVYGDTYISYGGLGVGATNTSNGTIRTSGGIGVGTSSAPSYGIAIYNSGGLAVGYSSPPSSGYGVFNNGITIGSSSSYSGLYVYYGGVGIGTSPGSSGTLYVGSSSNFYVPSSISTTSTAVNMVISSGRIYRYSSSMRYKDNIEDMVFTSKTKEAVYKIRPRTFIDKTTGNKDFGLIAEEVEQVVPDLVIYEPVQLKDASGNLMYDKENLPVLSKTEKIVEGVKYDRLSIFLLEIIKEHEAIIKDMQQTISKQQEEINALKK